VLTLGVIITLSVSSGCARVLTITQDRLINTAGTGRTEPLELNIVCVAPNDLKLETNKRLAPDSGITSDVWFKDRPIHGDTAEMGEGSRGSRFWLPSSQVACLTFDKSAYGTRIGDSLRGTAIDGAAPLRKSFRFPGFFQVSFDPQAVIYIFGKFTGPRGELLAVPPAKFHPPGAYTRDLKVHVGVREGGPNYGQYIEIPSNP
jgi:hypothetical protein